MKDKKVLFEECIKSFLKMHPELTMSFPGNALSNLLMTEKQAYAKIGIVYAIEFMMDEIARSKVN